MKGEEEFFPYFLIMVGLAAGIVFTYAPEGKGKDIMLNSAAGLIGGGLTAYGLPFRFPRKEDPPS